MIPNSIKSLGYHCFEGCSSLSSLTIPNSVKSLGDGCFYGCSSLSYLTIPKSVKSFGDSCFSGCSSLSTLIVPNSIAKIGVKCFQNCPSLQNFGISLKNLPEIINNSNKRSNHFYSEAGYDLFIGCPFKSAQIIH
jgi:hypothetical protein